MYPQSQSQQRPPDQNQLKDNKQGQNLLTWRLDRYVSHSDFTMIVSAIAAKRFRKRRRSDSSCESIESNDNNCHHDSSSKAISNISLQFSTTTNTKSRIIDADVCVEGNESLDGTYYYHVHKAILGAGAFRSEVLETALCRKMQVHTEDSEENNCRDCNNRQVVVPQATLSFVVNCCSGSCTCTNKKFLAKDVMSVILDYVYSHGVVSNITRNNAVAVRYIAEKLRFNTVFEAATNFISNDLTIHTCTYYMREMYKYHGIHTEEESSNSHRLFKFIIELASKNFESLDHEHLRTLELPLFQKLVTSSQLNCVSEELSCRVADYCRGITTTNDSKKEITYEWFSTVTSEDKMPTIFPCEGLYILNEAQKLYTNIDCQQRHYYREHYLSLQQRCMEAVSEYWSELLLSNHDEDNNDEQNVSTFTQLPLESQEQILNMALKVAQKEMNHKLSELSCVQRCTGTPTVQLSNNHRATSSNINTPPSSPASSYNSNVVESSHSGNHKKTGIPQEVFISIDNNKEKQKMEQDIDMFHPSHYNDSTVNTYHTAAAAAPVVTKVVMANIQRQITIRSTTSLEKLHQIDSQLSLLDEKIASQRQRQVMEQTRNASFHL